MKKEQLKKGDNIICGELKAMVLDLNFKENYIKVLINNTARVLINKDWLNDWEFENPIRDNRIVSSRTFAIRLKEFIENTKVADACSFDEKEYLLNVADNLLRYQIQTATTPGEIAYLKRLELL